MSIRLAVVASVVVALCVTPATTFAAKGAKGPGKPAPSGPTCNLPESDAEALVILNNHYPGYWWDHTNLTIAVQAHPSATDAQLDAIDDAIATWSSTLEACFDGLI